MLKSLAKFGASSVVATGLDILLFTFVFTNFLPVFESEILSGFIGMLVNFVLQKRFVFHLQRNQYMAFFLSLGFSLFGLFLGGFLIESLVKIELLATYLILPKLMVTGFKFFFNYFTKRWVFEKKGWTTK
ncbi:MAG: putative flippase GtrA [Salibacteraceae bacterium]